MSGRDLTLGVVSALTSGVVRPVLIGRLDIADDPITAWTGPGVFTPSGSGDGALDGQIFTPMAPFVQLSDTIEDQGIGGPATLTVTGNDLDHDLLVQVVRDKKQWLGRRAWLWLGLLNEDEATVVDAPFRIKSGVMTKMVVSRTKDGATVDVVIDRDLGNARAAPFRWIDHVLFYPDDPFSTFVVHLSNKPEGFTKGDFYNPRIRTPGPSPGGPRWVRR